MKRYTRLLSAVVLFALLLTLTFGVSAFAADEGVDTPIIEWPFDEEPTDPSGTGTPQAPDGDMPPWAIVLIIVGSVVAVAVIGFFVNWFFVLGRSFSDLGALFRKKDGKKKRK